MAQGVLLQRIGPNSFVINSDVVKDAAVHAARCWRAIGVPYGMDDTGEPVKHCLLTLCREAFLS